MLSIAAVSLWTGVILIFFYKLFVVVQSGRAVASNPLTFKTWKTFGSALLAFTLDNSLALILGLCVRVMVPGIASAPLSGLCALGTSIFIILQKQAN